MPEKIRVNSLIGMKRAGSRIAALTAYDFLTAQAVDRAGVDVILVGDSVGNVVLGYPTTVPVTIDEIVHHAKAVVRGVSRALIVADMPFLSYRLGIRETIRNAGRLVNEAGAEAVKLEGAGPAAPVIERLTEIGIPVMAHIGYTPQSAHRFGTHVVQGKTAAQATQLLSDAISLESAGAFAVVLECVPAEVARLITERLSIPTIGIGAGPFCDGQILVFHDAAGLTPAPPRFVKRYASLDAVIAQALESYIREIRDGVFPAAEHCYEMPSAERRALEEMWASKAIDADH
jgi:3-methyl-2-oxobutanoate hydroxymethyltransferase